MAMTSTQGMSFTSDASVDLYITGLKNAHALEKQATQLMERQIERLESYPDVAQVLRRHVGETEAQIQRIDEILHSFGEDRSLLKDLATSLSGNMAAIAHSVMPDEILKNAFANQAFENFEIASYTSLITMAEATGHQQHISALQQTLREEENVANWFRDHIRDITLRFMQLNQQGAKADR